MGSKACRAAAKVRTGWIVPNPLFGWVDFDAPVGVSSRGQSMANTLSNDTNLLLCPHIFNFATLLGTKGAYLY